MKLADPQDGAPGADAARAGFFIAIEGIDGTGKTTLAAALAEALRARGRGVATSFEPTQGPHGRRLRELMKQGREGVSAQEELDLFVADRREHVERVIRPALARGETLILDRYYYSTMAYQGARGLDPAQIERLHADFAPRPDLLVILELPIDEALARITEKRGETPNAFEARDQLEQCDAIFKAVRHPNVLRLDARRPTQALVGTVINHLSGGKDAL